MIHATGGTAPRITWRFTKTTLDRVGTTADFTQSIAGVPGLTVAVDIYGPAGGIGVASGLATQVDATNQPGLYYYDSSVSWLTTNGYYRCVATVAEATTVDSYTLEEYIYLDRSVAIAPTAAEVQLATITAMAQRRVDQLVTRTSGKWSQTWWTGLINEAKNIVAQETGFFWTRLKIDVAASQQQSDLPTLLAGGIKSLDIGSQKINVVSELDMEKYSLEWRHQSSLPNQPALDSVSVSSTSAGDDATVLTLHGVDIYGDYTTEGITISEDRKSVV